MQNHLFEKINYHIKIHFFSPSPRSPSPSLQHGSVQCGIGSRPRLNPRASSIPMNKKRSCLRLGQGNKGAWQGQHGKGGLISKNRWDRYISNGASVSLPCCWQCWANVILNVFFHYIVWHVRDMCARVCSGVWVWCGCDAILPYYDTVFLYPLLCLKAKALPWLQCRYSHARCIPIRLCCRLFTQWLEFHVATTACIGGSK